MNHSLTSEHNSAGSPGQSWGTDRIPLLGILGVARLIRVLHFLANEALGLLDLRLEEPGRGKAYFMRCLELEPEVVRADQTRRLLLQLGGSS